MNETTTLALTLGSIAAAAGGAMIYVRSRDGVASPAQQQAAATVEDPMSLPSAMKSSASPAILALAKPRRVIDRRRTQASRRAASSAAMTRARDLSAHELAALVSVALGNTYQWVRQQRQLTWSVQLHQHMRGKRSLAELEQNAKGHVFTAIVMGGDWDNYHGEGTSRRLAEFVLQAGMKGKETQQERLAVVLRVIQGLLSRPNNAEAGVAMDYAKRMVCRIAETAELADGSPPLYQGDPESCDPVAVPRYPIWVATRAPKLHAIGDPSKMTPAEAFAAMPRALGLLFQLQSEKNGTPQVGYPSEPNLNLGALFLALGKLFVAAMGGAAGVADMVDIARSYCEEESANPDGC